MTDMRRAACWPAAAAGKARLAREPPHDPVRIEFESREFVFCQDMASATDIEAAPREEFQQSMEGR